MTMVYAYPIEVQPRDVVRRRLLALLLVFCLSLALALAVYGARALAPARPAANRATVAAHLVPDSSCSGVLIGC